MIITCNNCNKKFDIDSTLIPDNGRLLQCASCDYKWFFKKEVLENTLSPIIEDIDNDSKNIFDLNNSPNSMEINPSELQRKEVRVDPKEKHEEKIQINTEGKPNKKIEVSTNGGTLVIAKPKKIRKFKILSNIIVVIISFVGFIIIIDTFKYPIGQVVPNIEFILYNLYESIKDISLFIRDLT